MSDASTYYLVGYTPTRRTNDGKFHEIKVKVKRRGVTVTARRGYWAASEKEMTAAAEAAATPVNVALTTALTAMSDSTAGRAVNIWTGVAKGESGRTRSARGLKKSPGTATPAAQRTAGEPPAGARDTFGQFGLVAHRIRELAFAGDIPGMVKASW